MKILQQNVGQLSNPEVLQIVIERLEQQKSSYRRGTKVESETKQYLSDLTRVWPRDTLIALAKDLKAFHFSDIEVLEILNHAPSTDLELYTVVRNLDQKLDPSQRQGVINLVQKSLFPDTALQQQLHLGGSQTVTSGWVSVDLMAWWCTGAPTLEKTRVGDETRAEES